MAPSQPDCRLHLNPENLQTLQNVHGLDIENGEVTPTANGRPNLYYAPQSPGWRFRDIDWKFVFQSQHYGTIVW